MQVYRGMDIGTAKVSRAERQEVPHHLIDIVDPDYPYSVAEFQARAKQAIEDIASRGRLRSRGGNGAVHTVGNAGYQFSEAEADEKIRARWRKYAEQHGRRALHDALKRVDPEYRGPLTPERRPPYDSRFGNCGTDGQNDDRNSPGSKNVNRRTTSYGSGSRWSEASCTNGSTSVWIRW